MSEIRSASPQAPLISTRVAVPAHIRHGDPSEAGLPSAPRAMRLQSSPLPALRARVMRTPLIGLPPSSS
jgi:hypothetical protein